MIEPLGRGGMGEVWLAERAGPGGVVRRAALKRILSRYRRDGVLLQRFMAEAKISARLEHSNLVRVLDFGESPEPYLVLEYVEGISAADLLQEAARSRAAVPAVVAAFVCAEAAAGLDYAHRKRDESGRPLHIVHRDVSPQNVLLSVDGAVKVGDFGVARAADNTLRTAEGIQIGKLVYMSPEQANGRPLDGRADVFSLGIVLWELLTLRPLFARDDAADTLARINGGDIPRPRSLVPHIPVALDEIAMTALQVDPEQRFATAAAFAQALRGFVHSVAPGFDSGELIKILHKLVPSIVWHVATPRPRGLVLPSDSIAPPPPDALATAAVRPSNAASPAGPAVAPSPAPAASPGRIAFAPVVAMAAVNAPTGSAMPSAVQAPPAPFNAAAAPRQASAMGAAPFVGGPPAPTARGPAGASVSPWPAQRAPAAGLTGSPWRIAALVTVILLCVLAASIAVFGLSPRGWRLSRNPEEDPPGPPLTVTTPPTADPGRNPDPPSDLNSGTLNVPAPPALPSPASQGLSAGPPADASPGSVLAVGAIQRALSLHEREFIRCVAAPSAPRARISLRVAFDASRMRASGVEVTSATHAVGEAPTRCIVELATRVLVPPKVTETATARWSFWIGRPAARADEGTQF